MACILKNIPITDLLLIKHGLRTMPTNNTYIETESSPNKIKIAQQVGY